MKKAKFKVGDRVIIKDGSKIKSFRGGWIKDMNSYIGKTCTISYVAGPNAIYDSYGYRMKEIDYAWDERGLELGEDKIIISIKGNVVKAEWNDDYATARCNPEDDFNVKTGTMIALERLFKMKDEIKEGDTVIITNTGHSYTTYTNWVTRNIEDRTLIAEYRYGETPLKGQEYEVVKIAKHLHYDDEIIYYIRNFSGCYLIGKKGIKKHASE